MGATQSTSALLAASLVALVAAAGWIVWKSEFIRYPVANGIAVLPFENFSPIQITPILLMAFRTRS